MRPFGVRIDLGGQGHAQGHGHQFDHVQLPGRRDVIGIGMPCIGQNDLPILQIQRAQAAGHKTRRVELLLQNRVQIPQHI